MSAFYRYTKFRPPLMKPAGDVMAERAVDAMRRFAKEPSPLVDWHRMRGRKKEIARE